MKQTHAGRLWQLAPLFLLLPAAAAACYALVRWGGLASDLLHVAVKLVVIP